jgi:hypothetical protein
MVKDSDKFTFKTNNIGLLPINMKMAFYQAKVKLDQQTLRTMLHSVDDYLHEISMIFSVLEKNPRISLAGLATEVDLETSVVENYLKLFGWTYNISKESWEIDLDHPQPTCTFKIQ